MGFIAVSSEVRAVGSNVEIREGVDFGLTHV
jgi:hypothetical protein